eukprot:14715128-Alexandrium_andersonii.AAC.1
MEPRNSNELVPVVELEVEPVMLSATWRSGKRRKCRSAMLTQANEPSRTALPARAAHRHRAKLNLPLHTQDRIHARMRKNAGARTHAWTPTHPTHET